MKVSDKVVCVDASPGCTGNIAPLKYGAVYVIESTGFVMYGPIVNLVGVSPHPHLGFRPNRFRLLKGEPELAILNVKLTP